MNLFCYAFVALGIIAEIEVIIIIAWVIKEYIIDEYKKSKVKKMKFADEIIKEKENSTRYRKNYVDIEEFDRWRRVISSKK